MLMTVKSDLTQSVAVIAIATAAGFLHGIVPRNVSRTMRPYERIEKSEAL
jgi:hypothetical protein